MYLLPKYLVSVNMTAIILVAGSGQKHTCAIFRATRDSYYVVVGYSRSSGEKLEILIVMCIIYRTHCTVYISFVICVICGKNNSDNN